MIIILSLDTIPLLAFGAVFKHSNLSPEDAGMIIGKYLGFPLVLSKSSRGERKGRFFLTIAKKL